MIILPTNANHEVSMSKKNFYKNKKSNSKLKTIDQYPVELRGPAQNRHGGHTTKYIRCDRANTFGPASECIHYSAASCEAYEAELRARGLLDLPANPSGRTQA
jgi:hypothetical protein